MNTRTINRIDSGAMPTAAVGMRGEDGASGTCPRSVGMAPKRRVAPQRRHRGLTLVEIVVVLVILVALAGLLLPMFGSLAFQSEANATMENLRRLQEMLINRYVADMKDAYLASGTSPGANPDGLPRATPTSPPQLQYLYLDPNYGTSSAGYNQGTGLGWNGPYVLTGQGIYPGLNSTATTSGFASGGAFGTTGDSTPLDAWGNPIVLVPIHDTTHGQLYYVVLSAGSTGTLGTITNGAPTTNTVAWYGSLQGTCTQYYIASDGSVTTTAPVPYTGGTTIWAVAQPLEATVTSSTTTSTSNLDNSSSGPTLTTTSDNATYQYWLPLK